MVVGGDLEATATALKNFTKKGKAVMVEHYLFDELWNMGSRKIPQTIKFEVGNNEDNDGDDDQIQVPEESK